MSFSGPQAEAVAVERNAGFWRSLLDAVRGVRADYTSIPIGRAIVLLAVPMVLEMAMESLFALVDIFWVGRLGADATAAVGSTESLFALVYAVAIGLAMGTTALVARRIGEKKEEQADLAAVQAIVLAMLASLPIALVGIVFGSGVLRLVDAADSVVVAGSGFTRTVLVANATVMLLHVINAIFRAAGDASVAMWVLFVANLINIVLDPLLIYGAGPIPALGVEGAAVATTIGRGTGVVIQIVLLARGRRRIRIRREHLRLQRSMLASLVRLS